jgi:hypothetical protein
VGIGPAAGGTHEARGGLIVSTTDAAAASTVELRIIPVSAIVPIEGWNPRQAFDDAELRALSASMIERGCLVPVRVQATGVGDHRLVDRREAL